MSEKEKRGADVLDYRTKKLVKSAITVTVIISFLKEELCQGFCETH